MDDFELELKKDFLDEAVALLDECEESFLELETSGSTPEIWDLIFRLAHNLKGTSRAVGFGQVAEFTHEFENLILKLKNGEVAINDEIVSLLLQSGDQLREMISGLREDIEASFDCSGLIPRLQQAAEGNLGSSVESSVKSSEEAQIQDDLEVSKSETSESEASDEEMEAQDLPSAEDFEEFHNSSDSQEVVPDSGVLQFAHPSENSARPGNEQQSFSDGEESYSWEDIDRMLAENNKEIMSAPTPKEATLTPVPEVKAEAPAAAKAKAKAKGAAVEDESIRVALSRIELLNNYVGELVILQTVLMEHQGQSSPELLNKELGHLGKICKEIQDISMRMRMVPLKTTFSKLNRIVRDTSKALDKKVNLHLAGEETEVDKTILEQLSDPLVHIIRNAVDHGVESSEDRVSKGKSPTGNIYIDSFHEGNNLIIEIGDDGAGIDPVRLREKAIAKGILKGNETLSNQELCELIFHPGFSTKDQVSEISGRGVGMDVVRTNVRKIGGEVILRSELGKGSLFKLSLPLTMAIIDGLVVGVANEKLVIPLSQVHETLQVTQENLKEVNSVGGCLVLRGEVIPAFRLSEVLKRTKPEEERGNSPEIAMVIRHEKVDFAVLVDDIFRQQQVVIKKLGHELESQKGFTGSSILGDGKPALILDLIELITPKMKKRSKQTTTQQAA